MKLVESVYQLANKLPKDEHYGLKTQMKRSCISIPSNVDEGAGRNSKKEFVRFLSIAQGSSYELQTQLQLALNMRLLARELVQNLLSELDEIQRMNRVFQQRISIEIESISHSKD